MGEVVIPNQSISGMPQYWGQAWYLRNGKWTVSIETQDGVFYQRMEPEKSSHCGWQREGSTLEDLNHVLVEVKRPITEEEKVISICHRLVSEKLANDKLLGYYKVFPSLFSELGCTPYDGLVMLNRHPNKLKRIKNWITAGFSLGEIELKRRHNLVSLTGFPIEILV